MRYLLKDPVQGWIWIPYLRYLESVRAELPEPLYAFASNEENYNLTSHTSLHDAWLDHISVREAATGERQEQRSIWIESCYLGPFHDLRIYLTYRGVQNYRLQASQRSEDAAPMHAKHGDLLIHEVRAVGAGLFEHELQFSTGNSFLIQFRDFEYRIEACS